MQIVIDMLFEHYSKQPDALPDKYRKNIEEDGLYVCAADYIAAMTDQQAVEDV